MVHHHRLLATMCSNLPTKLCAFGSLTPLRWLLPMPSSVQHGMHSVALLYTTSNHAPARCVLHVCIDTHVPVAGRIISVAFILVFVATFRQHQLPRFASINCHVSPASIATFRHHQLPRFAGINCHVWPASIAMFRQHQLPCFASINCPRFASINCPRFASINCHVSPSSIAILSSSSHYRLPSNATKRLSTQGTGQQR